MQGTEKYCPACGQKAATHRFTRSHFFHESWHAVTHTDKGILNLVKGFLSKESHISYWKPLLAKILYHVIWTVLVTFFFLWYVMRSNLGIAIKKLISELNK